MRRRTYLSGAMLGLSGTVAGCAGLLNSGPEFEVRSVDPGDTRVAQGEEVELRATIRNVGDEQGETDVELRLGDRLFAEETVELAADGTTQVSATVDTGDLARADHEYAVSLDGSETTRTLEVAQPASFGLSDLRPRVATRNQGDPHEVTVSVTNDGGVEATRSVEAAVDLETRQSESVTLEPGESTDVSFSLETDELSHGDHGLLVETPDDEVAGTLTVREAVVPVLEDETRPAPVVQDVAQSGNTFSGTVFNRGAHGTVGSALVFLDDPDADLYTVEPASVRTHEFAAGETRDVSHTGSPDGSTEQFLVRVWAAEFRGEVTNEGYEDAEVVAAVRVDDTTVATEMVEVPAGETVTVTVEVDLPDRSLVDATLAVGVPS